MNFEILQELANEFFQFVNFKTTSYLENLKKENSQEYEDYIKKSKIIDLYRDIENKVYSNKTPFKIYTPFDNFIGYYRLLHDSRHPLVIIDDLKNHIEELIKKEPPPQMDLDELEQY